TRRIRHGSYWKIPTRLRLLRPPGTSGACLEGWCTALPDATRSRGRRCSTPRRLREFSHEFRVLAPLPRTGRRFPTGTGRSPVYQVRRTRADDGVRGTSVLGTGRALWHSTGPC